MSFLQGYAKKLGVLEYLGTWNASTNTPSLTSSVGQKGSYYVVSQAGTVELDGVNDWGIADWVVFNGTVWQKIDNSDEVGASFGFLDGGAPGSNFDSLTIIDGGGV